MILLFDPMPGVPFRGLALTWKSATIGLHFVRSTDAITDKSWLSYNSQLPFTRCADWRVVPWFISEQVFEICNDEAVMVNDTLCNLTHYTNMFTHTHIVVISCTRSMSEVIDVVSGVMQIDKRSLDILLLSDGRNQCSVRATAHRPDAGCANEQR